MTDLTTASTEQPASGLAQAAPRARVVGPRDSATQRTIGRRLAIAWIAAGALLVALLPMASVDRAQEARVLEVAREMVQMASTRAWLIPHLNGELRLQKPPLAYWLAAGSFEIFGVSTW